MPISEYVVKIRREKATKSASKMRRDRRLRGKPVVAGSARGKLVLARSVKMEQGTLPLSMFTDLF
jgi:hypothetical protein